MGELEGRCGSCACFGRRYQHAELGAVGHCLLEIYAPPVQASSTCTRYRPKGAEKAAERPMAAGTPRKYRNTPSRTVSTPRSPDLAPTRPLPQEIDIDMDINEFRRVIRQVLNEELSLSDPQLGNRWQGGEVILQPGDDNTQEKRIPIETFFHKIVMVRDKLRVLEQKVNGHKGLSDEEKIQMQSYITACYGSLTTFNVLFSGRDDHFRSKH